jgi:hypothetical protein
MPKGLTAQSLLWTRVYTCLNLLDKVDTITRKKHAAIERHLRAILDLLDAEEDGS